MKTLLIINLAVTCLLFSWAAFASQNIKEKTNDALAQIGQETHKKNNEINELKNRSYNERQTSRLVERPVIHPIHFH